jgi:hypothetical protein
MPAAQPDVWSDPKLWVSIASTVITLCAILVALFNKELRAYWRAPKLEIALAHAKGVLQTDSRIVAPAALNADTEIEFWGVRFYPLRVSNPRRRTDAVSGVAVSIQHIEERGADGGYHTKWTGDAPLRWRNRTDQRKPEFRVVGTAADADFCSVTEKGVLWFYFPKSESDAPRFFLRDGAPFDFRVTVQARGNEVDSEPQKYRVFWDGNWNAGETEMLKHFHVTPVRS